MCLLKKQFYLIAFCLLLNTGPVSAADYKIVTPYWGVEENIYLNEKYGLEMKDSQTTKGLYLQSVNPEKYQWNVFIYRTEDINYSDLDGVNLIYDRYFGADAKVKNLIGLGVNYFRLDLAGENIPVNTGIRLDAFNLDQEITSLYLRIGRSYKYNQGQTSYSVLPWIGRQLDQSRGTGLVDLPGPKAIVIKIDEDQYSWIAGVNLKANWRHFLQLETKHSITYTDTDYLNKSSAMVNLFLTKNLGLSYRYNYHQTTVGKDSYHLLGLAVLF